MKTLCLSMISAAALIAGCSGNPSSSGAGSSTAPAPAPTLTAAQRATVDKAAAIANALERTADAQKVLADNGVTEQDFDNMMFEIAADPEMSLAYNARTTN